MLIFFRDEFIAVMRALIADRYRLFNHVNDICGNEIVSEQITFIAHLFRLNLVKINKNHQTNDIENTI